MLFATRSRGDTGLRRSKDDSTVDRARGDGMGGEGDASGLRVLFIS